jgi:hypothetical protein
MYLIGLVADSITINILLLQFAYRHLEKEGSFYNLGQVNVTVWTWGHQKKKKKL